MLIFEKYEKPDEHFKLFFYEKGHFSTLVFQYFSFVNPTYE